MSALSDALIRAFARQYEAAAATWEDMLPLYAELGYESEDALRLASPAFVRRSVRQLAARTLIDEGVSQREAARRLGVSQATIHADVIETNHSPLVPVIETNHSIQYIDTAQERETLSPSEAIEAVRAVARLADAMPLIVLAMSPSQRHRMRTAARAAVRVLAIASADVLTEGGVQ